LISVKISFRHIEDWTDEKTPRMREWLDKVYIEVDRSVTELRLVLTGMPLDNPHQPPSDALVQLLEHFAWASGFTYNFVLHGVAYAVSPLAHGSLIGVAREALANAAKHANTPRVEAQLNYKLQGVQLIVQDFGRGLPTKPWGRGLGLNSMRHRAEEVNGILTIMSEPGQGTRIELWIPRTGAQDGHSTSDS
jgi:signal transduction histidine kinase